MVRRTFVPVLMFVLTIFATTGAMAQTFTPPRESRGGFAPRSEPRTITVSGKADVHVEPDEVEIGLGIELTEPDLATAKKAADERMRAIIESLKGNGVAAKDIRTDRIYINPVYHYGDRERIFQGYQISQNLNVKVRDISIFENVISGALEAGANSVNGINFKSSEKQTHLDDARAMALDAARKKARAMANQLGQEIGRPLAIVEGAQPEFPVPMPYARSYANADMTSAGGAGSSETIAAGLITLTANVSVTFELVDKAMDEAGSVKPSSGAEAPGSTE